MIGDNKIVRFDQYCHKCIFKDKKESDPNSPCWDCLEEPVNQDSRMPVNFKEVTK